MTQSIESQVSRWGLVPLRLAVGVVFLMHGLQKIFVFGISGTAGILDWVSIPLASFFAVVLMIAEVGGGLAILLGAGARLAGAALAIEMTVAIFRARVQGGFFTPNGYEFEMVLAGACLLFAMMGSGGLSLDQLWKGRAAAN